jgi:Protein of unknown function (DUF1091)
VIEKCEFTADATYLQTNMSLVQEGDRSLLTVFHNVTREIPPPLILHLDIKYLSSTQQYDQTFLDVNLNMCNFFITRGGRNPFFESFTEYLRRFGKTFDRCPVRKVKFIELLISIWLLI